MKRKKGIVPGDKVGLTAPAGPVEAGYLRKSVEALKGFGWEVEVGDTCFQEYRGYVAGPPEMRAEELHKMFASPEISAIFCLRGGYGSAQILSLLDYTLIKDNPKLFIGYSDITALHIAFQQKSGISTIHGPMPASDLIDADEYTKYTLQSFLESPFSPRIIDNPVGEPIECFVPGKARGILTGGNLSLIASLMGTPYELDTKGKILFLEEVNEEWYRVDRMLTQLAIAGKFTAAAGIVLGSWTGCSPPTNDWTLENLFQEFFLPFNKPVLFNLRAGHCRPAVALPFGTLAEINGFQRSLRICD
ncbi:LD-carboxypeptidase [Siminovitchia sp. FSL H7-0308]|uniref:S66 peptidase family protein n=1 Tax=unclassified Siminovitchia TaxID=2837530 RepID=UPI0030CB3B8B